MTQNENKANDVVAFVVTSAIFGALLGAIIAAVVMATVGAAIGILKGFDVFNLIELGNHILEGAGAGAVQGAKLGAIGGAFIGAVKGLLDAKNAAEAERRENARQKRKIEAKRKAEKERKAAERKAAKERKAKAKREAKIESENIIKIHDAVSEAIRFACDAAIVNARISDLEYASPAERAAAKSLEDAQFQGNGNTRKRRSPAAIEAARIAGIETAAEKSIDRTCKAILLCKKVSAEKQLKALCDARKSTIEKVICDTITKSKRKTIANIAESIENTRSQTIEDARKLAAVSEGARIVTHVEKNVVEHATDEARLVATKTIVEKSSDYRKDFRHISAIEATLSIGVLDTIEAAIEESSETWSQDSLMPMIERKLSIIIRKASNIAAAGPSRKILNVPIHNYKQLPKLESPAGYVYVIKDVSRTNSYKIGRTNHPETRMNNFGVMLPFETKVIAILKTGDAETLEQRLHHKFAGQHNRGEWYDLSENQILEIQNM